jgi:hypothetical protein
MLPTGVCVVEGQLAEMPIIVAVDNIDEEHKPHNETLSLLSKWKSNNQGGTSTTIRSYVDERTIWMYF